MKKLLSFVIMLALCLCLVPSYAFAAEDIVASGEISDGRQHWVLDSAGTLTISGTGPMQDFAFDVLYGESGVGYRSTNLPWYRMLSEEELTALPYWMSEEWEPLFIKKVIIEEGIESIGANAFFGCNLITEVSLPSTLNRIGSNSFFNCDDLMQIVIPVQVTRIDSWAFDSCNMLSDVFYCGSEEQWRAISIAEWNDIFNQVNIHYGYVSSVSAAFTDVPSDAYYADAVLWAVNHDPFITNGIGNNRFGGEMTVTRGQAMTFLWRMVGMPQPSQKACPFADVKDSDYFHDAVLWAVENGITNGTSATTFSPELTCSCAHMLTFLWRTAGRPDDTNATSWYADAVTWAKGSGLLDGMEAHFSPMNVCPRADVVTYLYRFELMK